MRGEKLVEIAAGYYEIEVGIHEQWLFDMVVLKTARVMSEFNQL